jgi:hypothetical protein
MPARIPAPWRIKYMAWHVSCPRFDDPSVQVALGASAIRRNERLVGGSGIRQAMTGHVSAEICALSSSTSLLIAASEFPIFPTSLAKSLSETPNRFLTDLTCLGSARSIFVRSGYRFLIFIISFFQF